MNNFRSCIFFFLAVLFAAGCSLAEKSAINDSQFVMLYVDLSFAAEQFLSDSVHLAAVQDSIFDAHKVTRELFFNYKAELDKSPERWSGIWERIAEELTKREEASKPKPVKANKKEQKEQKEK